MSFDELAAYALACAGVTAIIVQLLNNLWISESPMTSTQKAAALRGLNYLINLILILGVLFTHNAFDPRNSLIYLALAFGQSLGSHSGYSLISNNASGQSGGAVEPRHNVTAPPSVPPFNPGE